jgi:tRNA(Ile2) C34 agmatinyltransferase TiaS
VPDPDDPLNDSGSPSNDERPPICPVCGVTMLPAGLSAWGAHDRDWACIECEETAEPDEV